MLIDIFTSEMLGTLNVATPMPEISSKKKKNERQTSYKAT